MSIYIYIYISCSRTPIAICINCFMWSLARVCFLKYIPLVIATLVTITDLRHEEPGLSDGKSRIKSDKFYYVFCNFLTCT